MSRCDDQLSAFLAQFRLLQLSLKVLSSWGEEPVKARAFRVGCLAEFLVLGSLGSMFWPKHRSMLPLFCGNQSRAYHMCANMSLLDCAQCSGESLKLHHSFTFFLGSDH